MMLGPTVGIGVLVGVKVGVGAEVLICVKVGYITSVGVAATSCVDGGLGPKQQYKQMTRSAAIVPAMTRFFLLRLSVFIDLLPFLLS